jgi:hypothetical protein
MKHAEFQVVDGLVVQDFRVDVFVKLEPLRKIRKRLVGLEPLVQFRIPAQSSKELSTLSDEGSSEALPESVARH